MSCLTDKKALGLWLLVVAVAGPAWALLPRIPQPLQHHQFADRHVCFGVNHCFDAASNALFIVAGLAGLRFLFSEARQRAFIDPRRLLTTMSMLMTLSWLLQPPGDKPIYNMYLRKRRLSPFALTLRQAHHERRT